MANTSRPSRSAPDAAPEQHDVFVSYNHDDRDFVFRIVELLQANELSVYLDRQATRGPGRLRSKLARAIESSATMAVFVGPSGEGRYQAREIDACVNQNKELVVVLLPGVPHPPPVPDLLEGEVRVDYRNGRHDIDALYELLSALTGEERDEIVVVLEGRRAPVHVRLTGQTATTRKRTVAQLQDESFAKLCDLVEDPAGTPARAAKGIAQWFGHSPVAVFCKEKAGGWAVWAHSGLDPEVGKSATKVVWTCCPQAVLAGEPLGTQTQKQVVLADGTRLTVNGALWLRIARAGQRLGLLAFFRSSPGLFTVTDRDAGRIVADLLADRIAGGPHALPGDFQTETSVIGTVDELLRQYALGGQARPVDYPNPYRVEWINWLYPDPKDGSPREETWAGEVFFMGPEGEPGGKLFAAAASDPDKTALLDKVALLSLREAVLDRLLKEHKGITFSINIHLLTLKNRDWFGTYTTEFRKQLQKRKATGRVVFELPEHTGDDDELHRLLGFYKSAPIRFALDDAYSPNYVFQVVTDTMGDAIVWQKMDWQYFHQKAIAVPATLESGIRSALNESKVTLVIEGVEDDFDIQFVLPILGSAERVAIQSRKTEFRRSPRSPGSRSSRKPLTGPAPGSGVPRSAATLEDADLKAVVDEICRLFADEPQRFRDVLFTTGFPTSQFGGSDTQSLATSFARICRKQTPATLAKAFAALHEDAPASDLFARLASRCRESPSPEDEARP